MEKKEIEKKTATYGVAIQLIKQVVASNEQCAGWLSGSIMRFVTENPTISLQDYIETLRNELPEIDRSLKFIERRYGV